MAQVRKINFAEFTPTGDYMRDMAELARLMQIALDDVYDRLSSGASGNFTTADTPAKTVTVEDGVISDIA